MSGSFHVQISGLVLPNVPAKLPTGSTCSECRQSTTRLTNKTQHFHHVAKHTTISSVLIVTQHILSSHCTCKTQCVLGGVQRQIPANGVQRQIPANGVQRQIPANGVQRQIPANGVQRHIPANRVQRHIPANGIQRHIPANVVQRQIPANGVQRQIPANEVH